jgi:hypothetical protein
MPVTSSLERQTEPRGGMQPAGSLSLQSLPVAGESPQIVNPSDVPWKPTCVNSRNVPNRSTFGF